MKWWRLIQSDFHIFCRNRWIFIFNQNLEYMGGSFFHAEIATRLTSVTRRIFPYTWNEGQSWLCKLIITVTCILFFVHLWTPIKLSYLPECKTSPEILRPQQQFWTQRKTYSHIINSYSVQKIALLSTTEKRK